MSFSAEAVAEHNSVDDAWVIFEDGVYDITDFLDENTHPGGVTMIVEYLGKDISAIFYDDETHVHTEAALERLKFYRIGSLEK
ncbi:fatty acid alpha-hydroxylase [Phlyctochytrium bullatum]|nr:fatty acid alpha-hydroxylase [Phlyctochytrium bullatum]